MKGILREKWNSESGSAQIIEMTLIFPIVLFVLGFLIYVGSYVLQSTAMYTEAQKIAVIAAREGQMPAMRTSSPARGSPQRRILTGATAICPARISSMRS